MNSPYELSFSGLFGHIRPQTSPYQTSLQLEYFVLLDLLEP